MIRNILVQEWTDEKWCLHRIETPLTSAPTVDVVPVVRCKECKYCDSGITEDGLGLFYKCLNGRSYGGTTLDSFCSWGERREDG